MSRKILTIGAYERDNFGDLLFFLVFEYICKKHSVRLIAGSCMESDMQSYFGIYIFPYHFLLSNYTFDAVWVVGGEIGACTAPMAIEMSLPNRYLDRYQYTQEKTKNFIQEYLIGEKIDHLAYLPNIGKYKKNKQTPLVVNSAGGFEFLEQYADMVIVQNTINTLQNAHKVTVRSARSHEYLLGRDIPSTLVPDSVHALSLFYSPGQSDKGVYIVFQMSKNLFNLYGIDSIAKSLYELVQKYNCPIYLFSAGTAHHHDSLEVYEDIKKYIHDTYQENRIEVIYEKNPLRRVDWIAHAKILISSSLHGRIVAISYKVPRVSLAIEKLSQYAETWDPLFPYGVVPSTMLDACDRAFLVDTTYTESVAHKLAVLAQDNIENILQTII